MATVDTIGEDSGTTWATVRAPVFNGNGFQIDTGPFPPVVSQKNWANSSHDAGYVKPLLEITKAFRFSASLQPWDSFSRSGYTPLGCCQHFISSAGDVAVYDYVLALGYGHYNYTTGTDEVRNAYSTFFGTDKLGYDYETLKGYLTGAVVNLTYYEQNGSSTTTDVTITADLFQEDTTGDATSGVTFHTILIDSTQPDLRPRPWWTINSVTLP